MSRFTRSALVAFVCLVLGSAAFASSARGQAGGFAPEATYRVILYLAEGEAPSDLSFQRLDEVVGEADGPERIRRLLEASSVQQLEDVTILPGGDTPALKIGNVTVRVRGIYKEPRNDAMFLRVEVEGGRETFVKEVVSRFDESLVLAYPLTEGNRSIIALLVPTRLSP
jgi:hypothetical protein